MADWFIYGLFSVAGLTGYRIAVKIIGLETSPILIMTICSFLYFCSWLTVYLLHGGSDFKADLREAISNKAVLIIVLAVSFFVSDYFMLRSYMAGAKLSIMTVLLGLSMLTTVLVGFLAFKETLSGWQAVGVVLGVASFVLLAAPPDNASSNSDDTTPLASEQDSF